MKAIKKTLVISITVVLAALTFGSCSSDELATTVTPKQEQQQGKTIIIREFDEFRTEQAVCQ